MSIRTVGLVRFATRLAAPIALLWGAAMPAAAVEQGPYSMEILVHGAPLDELLARGTTYVEALEGQEYSIRLRNRTGRRVAIALSVDGLNTIDAKTTTAAGASKWILEPHGTLTLDGWQTGSNTARRFFFTTEEKSYGAWLGQTSDLGVISAAFFRERYRRPAPPARPYASGEGRFDKRRQSERSPAGAAAPGGRDTASEPAAESSAAELESVEGHELSDELAATGIGRQLDHRVTRVRFDAESTPAAVLDVRYEYRDALVRLGVLPRHADCADPLARRQRARGFIDTGFAPDPYRCR